MDRFSALKVFTRVVEANSFTRAADSLNMPNATLSKTIQQLESHLGVRLLQRTTRRITVTPEGREYYEKALRILKDLEEIDASFKSARNKPKGHLRIAIGGSTARDVLIPLLAGFITAYPDIRLDLEVTDKPADLISGNIDCAVRGGPMEDSTLIARKIGDAALITCATPGYLKLYGIPAYPDELKNGHRLISYLSPASGRAFPFRFEHNGITTEIKMEHHLGINESNAHIAVGEAGLGIVQTFTYSVRNALASGVLVEILSQWRPAPYPFHIVYAQNRHIPPRLRVFIEWLVEAFPAAVKA
jgi:DNA-binding transcriptional LysR family regulator